jgi:hypothetical protein
VSNRPKFDATALQAAEVISLLRTLVAQNEMIRAQLVSLPGAIAAASQRRSAISGKDRDALSLLLPAISDAIGDANFAVRDLMNRATADADLRKALAQVLGPLSGGSARRLGGLLKRGAGVAQGGRRVVRLGEVREGAIWKVERE